jgi:dTDP-4-dehydrorhamnose 3,5-epimerase
LKITETALSGSIIIEPNVLSDSRGYFFETYQQERYAKYGIPRFVQDNVSCSKHNVLRGLHYQLPHAQGKLVWVTHGTIWDVIVDIRVSSPTFGRWLGITLSAEHPTQLYIPPGFAHGFCVLSEEANFYYKCTDFYTPAAEHGIAWNDTHLNITWPITDPILSGKDTDYLPLHQIPHDQLFA